MPKTYYEFSTYRSIHGSETFANYSNKKASFVSSLLPQLAVEMSGAQTVAILRARLGEAIFHQAIAPTQTVPSPVAHCADSTWIKTVNTVGINVRTIGSFWNVVKYALTLPAAQQGIHLLPIWEVGVVASLYGISSWRINPEFYSEELRHLFPHLYSADRQLKVVINLLHALGKVVGMDVIPHTDRYSEIAIAHPQYFEWLQREEFSIVSHRADLHEAVQEVILAFLRIHGSAVMPAIYPDDRAAFFEKMPEAERLRILFGEPSDLYARNTRRNALVHFLYERGYEPVPATMAPPYRGLAVSRNERDKTVDYEGRVWRDYAITQPEPMSRVFGPLARFKFYERLNDNREWEIDFDRPRPEVWDYFTAKYADMQREYNFDFMRGDMSHVQMRRAGVPATVDNFYDPLKSVKKRVQQSAPYFAYFAETFLAPDGLMAYGSEADHLACSDADATLGDLQSMVVGTPQFLQQFRRYLDLLHTRTFAPSFTILTGDKDDPRFDGFYLANNEARYFIALFLTDMPSYMALGFECRDLHFQPAPNEHYTKLYVFQLSEGEKATHGPYRWGRNGALFGQIDRMRIFADGIFDRIRSRPVRWLLPPDATGYQKTIAWTQADDRPEWVFVVNLDADQPAYGLKIPFCTNALLLLDFTTSDYVAPADSSIASSGLYWHLHYLGAGECRAYQLNDKL